MEALKTFYEKVDLRSRQEMTEFLANHFRYDTMSSWNCATSWANNMKIDNVIPGKIRGIVYEMMEAEGFYDTINFLIEDYGESEGHWLQAGFSGRSGGYLVLYEGCVETKYIFQFNDGKKKDYADGFGWLSLSEAKERGLYKKEIKKVSSYPGRSMDNYDKEDYTDMEMSDIREIVRKVQKFDKLCDDVVSCTIGMAENNSVTTEEYNVTKTRKVII